MLPTLVHWNLELLFATLFQTFWYSSYHQLLTKFLLRFRLSHDMGTKEWVHVPFQKGGWWQNFSLYTIFLFYVLLHASLTCFGSLCVKSTNHDRIVADSDQSWWPEHFFTCEHWIVSLVKFLTWCTHCRKQE